MTRPAVYLETSVVGYATSRPSRDLVVAGHQQITREWFAIHAQGYELFISQLVISEASGGDETAARERVAFLQGIPRLGITDAAGELAAKLVESGVVPRKAAEDALHIAQKIWPCSVEKAQRGGNCAPGRWDYPPCRDTLV